MADSLEERVLALVDRRLDERLAALGVAPAVYTSTALPPGIRSREHFAAVLRRLKIGEKCGRVWTVTASEWRQAREAARRPPASPRATSLEEQADAMLESSGLRLVRGQRP